MFDKYPTQSEAYEYFTSKSDQGLYALSSIEGSSSKKSVLITGGIHGNENCGPASMAFLAKHLESKKHLLKGTVHFLLGNPEAFGANRRFIDKDLNRSFLSNYTENYESDRAKEIEKFLSNNSSIQAVLDLHSVSIGDTQLMIYKLKDKEIAQKISPLSTHLLYSEHNLNGLFLKACDRYLNCFTCAVECGNHTARESHIRALFHSCSLLKEFEIFEDNDLIDLFRVEVESSPIITRYEVLKTITPSSNFSYILPKVESEVKISKGMIYARSDDGDHQASEECYLMLPSSKLTPDLAEYGFLCSREVIPRKISSN